MIHFLVAMSSSISLPPQLSPGSLEEDDNVLEPLDGQPGNRLDRVLAELLLVARITTKYIIVEGALNDFLVGILLFLLVRSPTFFLLES
jgi:hypothetical protein